MQVIGRLSEMSGSAAARGMSTSFTEILMHSQFLTAHCKNVRRLFIPDQTNVQISDRPLTKLLLIRPKVVHIRTFIDLKLVIGKKDKARRERQVVARPRLGRRSASCLPAPPAFPGAGAGARTRARHSPENLHVAIQLHRATRSPKPLTEPVFAIQCKCNLPFCSNEATKGLHASIDFSRLITAN